MNEHPGTPGPWFVRKLERDGELLDCFVAAPDCSGFPYDAEILGDDEYREGIERKLADCELIVATVNAHRATPAHKAREHAEPVAIYHGAIDCGEHGAHNLEMLKMIARGAKLYTHAAPQAPASQALTDAQIVTLVGTAYGSDTVEDDSGRKEIVALVRLIERAVWAKLGIAPSTQGEQHG